MCTPTGFGVSFQYTPSQIRKLTLVECYKLNDALAYAVEDREKEKAKDQLVNPYRGSVKNIMKRMQEEYRAEHGL